MGVVLRRRGRRETQRHRGFLGRGCFRLFLHRPDKAIAIAPAGLNELLRTSGVPNGLAGALDTALDPGVADELCGPHMGA